MQAVNISGGSSAVEVTDVSLQLTVATTADQTTSLYVFLGGNAVDQLNQQLKAMGEQAIQHSISACLPMTGTKFGNSSISDCTAVPQAPSIMPSAAAHTASNFNAKH